MPLTLTKKKKKKQPVEKEKTKPLVGFFHMSHCNKNKAEKLHLLH